MVSSYEILPRNLLFQLTKIPSSISKSCQVKQQGHPVREGGEKLTKIYPKSYFDFRTDYSLKFCFPKKVNFFIDGKNF